MPKERVTLADGWKWRLSDANGCSKALSMPLLKQWTPTASFPSVIQMELLATQQIPDPNIAQNERAVQWVPECDWEYSCAFQTPAFLVDHERVDLLFEGLDTFATIFLNEQKVAESDNMFVPLRVDVKKSLAEAGEQNDLKIIFESPFKWGTTQEEQYGKRKMLIRDPRRMYARKCQSHYGWDWGPVIITSGPYMPAHLEMYSSRFSSTHITTSVDGDGISAAEISISVQVSPEPTKKVQVQVEILDDAGHEVTRRPRQHYQTGNDAIRLKLENPKLWWPNGHGSQPLYHAKMTLYDETGKILDCRTDRFGVRTIKLIQRPLLNAPGETFMFNVNGEDIFMQGCNWIPADNLLPRINRDRYFAWIKLAQTCHMNMVRVWGGGIYETEDFYDACDEMGLLVWQDYCFACGDYPIHDSFLENVGKEAAYQTTRLRNRASLAVLCGGNEDFMTIDLFFKDTIKFDHFDMQGPFDDKPFEQRKIYLNLLPAIASFLAPEILYWPNSPFKGDPSDDPTMGDAHVWEVWHGQQLAYQKYGELSARFVSEFGMHGFPVMRTVDLFFSNDQERHPQSRAVDCHNKGHGAETRIARYLSENFRYDMRLENFVYCSQLLQSEAYGYALRDWKRKFGGPGKELCAGALIWQLNDIYPVTSWAFIDYFLRPKPAFYTIRRSCATVSVGIHRTPRSRWYDEDRPAKSMIPSFEFFAHNMSSSLVKARMEITGYEMSTDSALPFPPIHTPKDVELLPGHNTELYKIAHEVKPGDEGKGPITENSLIVLCVCLKDPISGQTLSRLVDWPEPFRYLHWPSDTNVSAKVIRTPEDPKWKAKVSLSANRPVKGCWVSAEGLGPDDDEPIWDDNMVDLMPGEELFLKVNDLPTDKIKVRFLGDWELSTD